MGKRSKKRRNRNSKQKPCLSPAADVSVWKTLTSLIRRFKKTSFFITLVVIIGCLKFYFEVVQPTMALVIPKEEAAPKYWNLNFISRLNELNAEYDSTRDSAPIGQIAKVIIENFYSEKIKNPDRFSKTIQNQSFYSFCPVDQLWNQIPSHCQTFIKSHIEKGIFDKAEFVGRFRDNGARRSEIEWLPFDLWWNTTPILNDKIGHSFTRQGLLLSYAMYQLQQNFMGIEKLEDATNYNFTNWTFDGRSMMNIIEMDPAKRAARKPLPKELQNNLIEESIRTISEEIVVTWKNNNL